MPIDLAVLKARLADLHGIGGLSLVHVLNRDNYGFNDIIASVDPKASIDDVEWAIRKANAKHAPPPLPTPVMSMPARPATLLPPVSLQPARPKPMSTPAPGSFSASLKAMIDEAKAGLQQAQDDGRARVAHAVGKLNDAKVSTTKVATGMASEIEAAANEAMSDLGQISNMGPE